MVQNYNTYMRYKKINLFVSHLSFQQNPLSFIIVSQQLEYTINSKNSTSDLSI